MSYRDICTCGCGMSARQVIAEMVDSGIFDDWDDAEAYFDEAQAERRKGRNE